MRARSAIFCAVVLISTISCVHSEYAFIPDSNGSRLAIDSCLAPLGFSDESDGYSESIANDDSLVAVWVFPHPGLTSGRPTRTTAWVRKTGARWEIHFFPGPSEAHIPPDIVPGFSNCIHEHGSLDVTWSSKVSPELR